MRQHPDVEMDLLQAMRTAVAQIGREAVAQLARRIS